MLKSDAKQSDTHDKMALKELRCSGRKRGGPALGFFLLHAGWSNRRCPPGEGSDSGQRAQKPSELIITKPQHGRGRTRLLGGSRFQVLLAVTPEKVGEVELGGG